jgi:hypothetical protein
MPRFGVVSLYCAAAVFGWSAMWASALHIVPFGVGVAATALFAAAVGRGVVLAGRLRAAAVPETSPKTASARPMA